MRNIWIFILLICLAISCTSEEERAVIRLLDQAESLIKSEPQKAHALLDSITYPEKLNDKLIVRYCLISGKLADTLQTPLPFIDDLDRAWFYLDEHGKIKEQAQIGFYLGRSLKDNDIAEPALRILLDAQKKSLSTNNYALAASISDCIGDICYDLEDHDLSKEYYLQAASYFKKHKDKKHWGLALKDVARAYALLDSCQLASTYMLKADSILRIAGDSADLSLIYNGIGNIYATQGEYEQAKKAFYQAIALDSLHAAPTYLALGRVYLALDSLERTEEYFQKAKRPTDNPDTHTELLYDYATLEERKGNLDLALSYMRQFVDSSKADILEMKRANLIKAQTLFDRKQIVYENIRLYQERERLQMLFAGALLTVLILIMFYQYRINRRDKRIIQQTDELREKKMNLHQQEIELKNFTKELEKYQQWSQEQLEKYEQKVKEVQVLNQQYQQQRLYVLTDSMIYKKVRKLATSVQSSNGELLSAKDWNAIYKLAYTICPKLTELLSNAGITPTEKKYCYLSFFQLDAKQEAILLGVGADTPHKNRTRIRQKLNISGLKGNLYDFFMQAQ